MLVEGTKSVGVQVVENDADHLCVGKSGRDGLAELGTLFAGARRIDLGNAHSRQWFDGCKERTGTVFLVGVVLFTHHSALHSDGFDHIANEKTGTFIQTHDRPLRVVRLCIQPQNALHVSQKPRIDFTETPVPLQVRFEFVFFYSGKMD